ncbi:HAMP domain-containing sensor histidine kinase [Pseudoduganella sp. LjRoot289]|uniref:sensor histidine kinase n=1 Tax=Pseudoduganella sp. LjRoot289 TaxID=3342314 RepID=UPI003ECDC9E2
MKVRSLLALTITVALVPVVVFFAAPLARLVDAERDAGVRGMQETARATSLAVDGQWNEAIGLVRALSASSKLEAEQMAAFAGKARSLIADGNAILLLYDANGQQRVNTALPEGAAMPDTRAANRERIAKTLTDGKIAISDVQQGPVTRTPMVALEYPFSLGEDRQYVLAYAFAASRLASALPPLADADTTVRIYDRQARLIQTNRRDEEIASAAPPAIAAAIRSRREGLHALPDGGYAVLTASPVTGWWVAISTTADRIDGNARRIALLSGLGLLLALLLAVATAWAISARIAKAIAQTSAAANAIGSAPPLRPKPSGIDEVDELGDSIYQAAHLLAEAAAERERLLVQAQQAREVADTQNRAKDEFLAMLGHELRNPMAPISVAAHMLAMPGLSEQQLRQASDVIARQSSHMNRLVNDLLDVSRVTRGLISLDLKPIEIQPVIASAVEQTTSMAAGQGDILTVAAMEDGLWVHGDAIRLVQVLANLLANAVKYSPPQSRIQVEARRGDGGLLLTVTDNGSGIEAGLLPRIFELFSQGVRRPDRADGGLGLGLALVRKIVELHGGSVAAYSEGVGKGSSFVIRLPLCPVPME